MTDESGRSLDGTEHNVPREDVDYAVENALWIASCCQEVGDRRSFMDVFASQLETHWDCLLALWADDGQDNESADETVQQTLVTDGGQLKDDTDHTHVCGYCGSEFYAHYDPPFHRPCPQCRSRKTECGCNA